MLDAFIIEESRPREASSGDRAPDDSDSAALSRGRGGGPPNADQTTATKTDPLAASSLSTFGLAPAPTAPPGPRSTRAGLVAYQFGAQRAGAADVQVQKGPARPEPSALSTASPPLGDLLLAELSSRAARRLMAPFVSLSPPRSRRRRSPPRSSFGVEELPEGQPKGHPGTKPAWFRAVPFSGPYSSDGRSWHRQVVAQPSGGVLHLERRARRRLRPRQRSSQCQTSRLAAVTSSSGSGLLGGS